MSDNWNIIWVNRWDLEFALLFCLWYNMYETCNSIHGTGLCQWLAHSLPAWQSWVRFPIEVDLKYPGFQVKSNLSARKRSWEVKMPVFLTISPSESEMVYTNIKRNIPNMSKYMEKGFAIALISIWFCHSISISPNQPQSEIRLRCLKFNLTFLRRIVAIISSFFFFF